MKTKIEFGTVAKENFKPGTCIFKQRVLCYKILFFKANATASVPVCT
jgi:hypothetical protein